MRSGEDICLLEPPSLTEPEWQAAANFSNAMRAEQYPCEQPETLETFRARWLNVNPTFERVSWGCWDQTHESLLGFAVLSIFRTDSNRHLAVTSIEVLHTHRRRGIGAQLLGEVLAAAQHAERRLLIGDSSRDIPAGEAFARRIGAQHGMDEHVVELDLAEVDRDLLERWIERAAERAGDFELGVWEGAYAEEDLDDAVAMHEAARAIPHGDLEIESRSVTKEHLREVDRANQRRGITRWTIFARHRPSGEIAGFTQLRTDPSSPGRMEVSLTAVFERYQQRGLGRWLKAAITAKVLNERPDITRIRTGNAVSNAPMRHINDELGFKLIDVVTGWQIDVDVAQKYVAEKSAEERGPLVNA